MNPTSGASSISAINRRGGPRLPIGLWIARVAIGVGVILLAVLVWYWPSLHSNARAGASFGARVGCSCRFVEGRPLAQCKRDFEPGMSMITLSEDDTAKSVTARFPLLASQTATFHEGQGCVLDKWAR